MYKVTKIVPKLTKLSLDYSILVNTTNNQTNNLQTLQNLPFKGVFVSFLK